MNKKDKILVINHNDDGSTTTTTLHLHPSGRIIDTTPVNFHGYIIHYNGTVIGKNGNPLKTSKRDRRGGGYDLRVTLCYAGKCKKWTLTRLIGDCFLGNIHEMEMNHLVRDPTKCAGWDIEISTRKENQKHWRDDEAKKEIAK